MKSEKIKSMYKALGQRLHLNKKHPLEDVVIINGDLYINGKPADKNNLDNLILLYRLLGLL